MNQNNSLFSDDILGEIPWIEKSDTFQSTRNTSSNEEQSRPLSNISEILESTKIPEEPEQPHLDDSLPETTDVVEKIAEREPHIGETLQYLIEKDPAYQALLRSTDYKQLFFVYSYRSLIVAFILFLVSIWIKSQRVQVLGWYSASFWNTASDVSLIFMVFMFVWTVWWWTSQWTSLLWQWILRSLAFMMLLWVILRFIFL